MPQKKVSDTVTHVILNTINGVVYGRPFETNGQQILHGVKFLRWMDERYAHVQ